MQLIEKLFDSRKGIIIFYIIIAMLSLLLSKRINIVNSQARVETIQETYYA